MSQLKGGVLATSTDVHPFLNVRMFSDTNVLRDLCASYPSERPCSRVKVLVSPSGGGILHSHINFAITAPRLGITSRRWRPEF